MAGGGDADAAAAGGGDAYAPGGGAAVGTTAVRVSEAMIESALEYSALFDHMEVVAAGEGGGDEEEEEDDDDTFGDADDDGEEDVLSWRDLDVDIDGAVPPCPPPQPGEGLARPPSAVGVGTWWRSEEDVDLDSGRGTIDQALNSHLQSLRAVDGLLLTAQPPPDHTGGAGPSPTAGDEDGLAYATGRDGGGDDFLLLKAAEDRRDGTALPPAVDFRALQAGEDGIDASLRATAAANAAASPRRGALPSPPTSGRRALARVVPDLKVALERELEQPDTDPADDTDEGQSSHSHSFSHSWSSSSDRERDCERDLSSGDVASLQAYLQLKLGDTAYAAGMAYLRAMADNLDADAAGDKGDDERVILEMEEIVGTGGLRYLDIMFKVIHAEESVGHGHGHGADHGAALLRH